MLGLQYLLTYVGYASDSSVSIGFLTFMSHWIPKWRCADSVAAFSCLSHKRLHFVFSGSKKESLLEFIMDDLWRQHIYDILPI